jgi:hypothetical protein
MDGFYDYPADNAAEPTVVPEPLTGRFLLPAARVQALFHCFLRHGANAVERHEHDGQMSALLCPGCGRTFWMRRSGSERARRELQSPRVAVATAGVARNRW